MVSQAAYLLLQLSAFASCAIEDWIRYTEQQFGSSATKGKIIQRLYVNNTVSLL